MQTVEEITRELVLKMEKEETEEHGAYCSADVDEMGCEFDGYLDVKEMVQFVLNKVKNG